MSGARQEHWTGFARSISGVAPAHGLVLLIVLGATLVSVDRAARRPFWFDEILTVAVANQRSPAAIWSALKRGVDGNPPLFHLVEKAFGAIASEPGAPDFDRSGSSRTITVPPEIAYRVPSILAFALTMMAVFVYVRHGAGPWPAVAAASVLLPTQLFTVYAIEARPYALVAGAIAWAAVMWQRADRGSRYVLGFGMVLTLAVSLHYYAVVAWLPFTVAELTRWRRTASLRLSVWLALVLSLTPLVVFGPLIAAMRAEFGPHFWAQPPIAGFLRAYDTLLNLSNWWGVGLSIVLAAAFVALMVGGSALRPAGHSRPASEEAVLAVTLLLLPPLAYVAAYLAGVGIVARYLIPALLGFAFAVAFVTAHSRFATAAVIAVSLCVTATRQLETWYIGAPLAKDAVAAERQSLTDMVASSGHPDLPVAIASALSFLPLAYYDSARTLRPVYLTDRGAAVRYAGTDTVDLLLERAAPVLSVAVSEGDQFLTSHDRFLVYAGTDLFDWLPSHLAASGYRLESVGRSANNQRVLYLAERQSGSP